MGVTFYTAERHFTEKNNPFIRGLLETAYMFCSPINEG